MFSYPLTPVKKHEPVVRNDSTKYSKVSNNNIQAGKIEIIIAGNADL